MKKKVKNYPQQIEVSEQSHEYVLKDFSRILDKQIENIVLFLLEKQGNWQAGRELLQLLFFVKTNAIGVRKILKKFYKRCGYKFTNYYVKTRANHPYSHLRQIFQHVGVSAVVGTISRNLADLQDNKVNFTSIYDHPGLPFQDPIIGSINQAMDRLTNSTDSLHYLGKHASILPKELPTPSEDHAANERYHLMSLLLNLANAFLYMVNNIIVPTADDYSMSFGAVATLCGAVIGRSMAVVQVSAGLVSASALGMACGPDVACLFQTNFKFLNITFNQDTLPGWIMALACWKIENGLVQKGITQPLLLSAEETKPDEDDDQDCDNSEKSAEEIHKHVTSIVSVYKFLTPSVKVQLLIYFMLKAYKNVMARKTIQATEVLEGVNLNLLYRVMSSRISKETYNGGLLSTEAGTLARVFADRSYMSPESATIRCSVLCNIFTQIVAQLYALLEWMQYWKSADM
ncbi:hypothetical protein KY290_017485 [Solanum tuberosum]|uniref:SPX domain-containing protein n=1 Tax=Solanum tuberosum TaxID=4113 RepID=A0ABQ7VBI9_SOLTU|nr:hypothetical protein KY289_016685 [Solanum tuberosum]KAH0761412.1 hypothetical protein KY290_017485 [Solanum tuberosum]